MHNEGYSTMCGHGIIAVATLVFERGLLSAANGGRAGARFAGRSHSRARALRWHTSGRRQLHNVPSFVLHAGIPVRANGRDMRADVAFGGAFYAIVDSESAGIPVSGHRLDDLRRTGMAIKEAVESAIRVEHPLDPGLNGIYGTIFTGAAIARGCGPSQRHDLRRSGSRSLAVRNRDVRRDGRPRGNGATGPGADVHSREHHRQPVPGASGG